MSFKKNPLQILNDLAKKKNQVPYYELIYSGIDGATTLFKYSVVMGEYSGFGSGRSKKEAKHDAACTILKRISCNEYLDNLDLGCIENIYELSPYSEVIKDNYVGLLKDLCVMYHLPNPVYDLKSGKLKTGNYFYIECILSSFYEIACSGSKKQAKQLVAKKMIDRLRSVVDYYFTAILKINDRRDDIVSSRNKNLLKFGMKLSEYQLFLDADEFQYTPLPTLDCLRDKDIDWVLNHYFPEELLDSILLELGFTKEIKMFKNKPFGKGDFKITRSNNSDRESQTEEEADECKNRICDVSSQDELKYLDLNSYSEKVFVLLTVKNCFPVQVFVGTGCGYEDAVKKARVNAVLFYFYMSKNKRSFQC